MPHLPFCNCIIAASGGRCQRRPEEVRKPWTSEKPDKQTKEYACEKNKLCRIDKNDENVITGRQLKCRIIIMRRNRRGASDLPLLRGNKKLVASDMTLATSWYARRDSNPQHSEPESDALSIELRAHFHLTLNYYSRISACCKGGFSINFQKVIHWMIAGGCSAPQAAPRQPSPR